MSKKDSKGNFNDLQRGGSRLWRNLREYISITQDDEDLIAVVMSIETTEQEIGTMTKHTI